MKAKAKDGTVANLEVQVRCQSTYCERSLYYWSKSYTDQLQAGLDYGNLKPAIGINILNFSLFPPQLPFHTTFKLFEVAHRDYCLTDDCLLHFLELPKFEAGDGVLADWLYALKHLDEQEGPMKVLLERNQSLAELAHRYRRFEADPAARMAYEDREKWLHDHAQFLHDALVKGRAEGARAKALAVAQALLTKGLSRTEVAQVTGLPDQELPPV